MKQGISNNQQYNQNKIPVTTGNNKFKSNLYWGKYLNYND